MTPEQYAEFWSEVRRWSVAPTPYDDNLRKADVTTLVNAMLAAERAAVVAACAKVCDDAVCTYNSNEQDMLAKQLAFLIRARKDA